METDTQTHRNRILRIKLLQKQVIVPVCLLYALPFMLINTS